VNSYVFALKIRLVVLKPCVVPTRTLQNNFSSGMVVKLGTFNSTKLINYFFSICFFFLTEAQELFELHTLLYSVRCCLYLDHCHEVTFWVSKYKYCLVVRGKLEVTCLMVMLIKVAEVCFGVTDFCFFTWKQMAWFVVCQSVLSLTV
jgi:hypothetical protein